MQSSEFIKSLYFGNNSKKTATKLKKKTYFHLKMNYYSKKYILLNWNRVDCDRPDRNNSDKTNKIWNLLFSRKLW